MKVAVSGVGGGVGQSIMKALTISTLPVDIVAIDVQPLSAGIFRTSESVLLSKPETSTGIEEWENYLQRNEVDALIPGSDHDLLPLAAVRDHWDRGGVCKVLVSDIDLVEVCRDKAATCQLLEREGIPSPRSAWDLSLKEAVSWAHSNGYPVVVKPRDGYGSVGLHIVHDEEELRFFYPRAQNPILQEYLGVEDHAEEFTCAVFVDTRGVVIGTFMARRELSGGATYRAEINFWPEIDELLRTIGAALRPRGVLNVQLRRTDRGLVPFELNIRCSGTTGIRAYFGYNEPEMLLRHYVLGEELTAPAPRVGYVLRYWNEVFLDGSTPGDIEKGYSGLKGEILAWP